MKKQLLLGFAGAVFAIIISAVFSGLFQQWEWKTLDFRFQLRGPVATDPGLVMIDADDASASVPGYGQWPWDRSLHARMMQLLKSAGAAVVAYDILFARPGDHNTDMILVGAAKSAGNVVFPVAVSLRDNRTDPPPRESSEDSPFPIRSGIGNSPRAGEYWSVKESIFPLFELAMEARGVGHIAANRDEDGVVRRAPLVVRYEGEILPSLAFRAVMDYLKVPGANVEIGGPYILLKQARFPGTEEAVDIRIPVDAKGQMLINYAGRWVETFKHASFASVLSEEDSAGGEDLTGRLLLVSNTMSGYDIKPIPIEKDYPGSGIHANIINTILTRNFLRETHRSTHHALILLLCLATALVFRRGNYLLQSGLFLLLLGSYMGVNMGFFLAGWVLPLFTPMFAMVMTALLVAIYRASVEKDISDKLIDEKRHVEAQLESIIVNLARKETELKKIGDSLNEMRDGIDRSKELGKEQAGRIADLQRKLQAVIEDKEKLQTERTELENTVLDLRVHISFDEVSMESGLETLKEECGRFGIITQSPALLEAFRILKRAAAAPSSVLILGESGTGKELFARALHQMSARGEKRFIAVNLAAVPETLVESELFGHAKGAFTGAIKDHKGRFAEADQGTLFLDEIGEIKKDIQVKLLRVLQEKEVQLVGGTLLKVDVRIIAATSKNLEEEIREGRFRDDLFYRLNTIIVTLPALRDRKEDIPILARAFIDRYRIEYGKKIDGISDRAMEKLSNHGWRGNVRELENVIQRGITMTATELIREKDLGLKTADRAETELPPLIQEGDELMLNALRQNRFAIRETAVCLKMSRNTVASRFKGICFDLLVKHNLDRQKTAETISPAANHQDLVLQRIDEYHDNLIKTAEAFATEEEALTDAMKRAKNIPLRYHPAVEELVRNCFANK